MAKASHVSHNELELELKLELELELELEVELGFLCCSCCRQVKPASMIFVNAVVVAVPGPDVVAVLVVVPKVVPLFVCCCFCS